MRGALLILVAALATPAWAQESAEQEVGPQEPAPLTLEQVRASVEREALSVALARWDREAAKADVARWTGAALPSVTGFVTLNAGGGLLPQGFPRPVAWQGGVGVRGTVRVLDPSTWAAAAAARRSLRGQIATVSWARVQARQRATELYATVVLEQEVASALQVALRSAEEDRAAVAELVAAGLRPKSDEARTEADVANLTARQVEALGRAVEACVALQDLMASEIDGACPVVRGDLGPPDDGPNTHPALVAAEEAVAAAKAGQASAVGAQLPTITADGQVAQYATPNGGGPGWGVGVSVDVPLRVLNEGRGELMDAAAARGRAEESLDGQARALDAARVAAEARLKAANAAMAARERAVDASSAALRQVQERYRAGLANVSALLDARRADVDAQVGLLRAEAERWAAVAAVEAARGVGG